MEASVFALVRKPRASTIGLVANVQYVSCSSYSKTYIAILRVEALEGVFALAICERRNSRARTNLKKKSDRHKAEGHQRLEARIRHDSANEKGLLDTSAADGLLESGSVAAGESRGGRKHIARKCG